MYAIFHKVLVYLHGNGSWKVGGVFLVETAPKRLRRKENAYRDLVKHTPLNLDRRGAMEKIHFNAVQQVVASCRGGKKQENMKPKKHTLENTHGLCFSLVHLVFLLGMLVTLDTLAGLTRRKFTSIRSTMVTGRRDSCLVGR